MTTDFNPQPSLTGPTLALAPLHADDRDGLFKAAGDPLIWAGHPIKNRHEKAVFDPYFDALLKKGTTLAARNRELDEIVGCSCYYVAPGVEDDISIGYTFLRRDHWGGGANLELKALMLDHAFETFENVWLHIGPDNIRSQRATMKIGADFSHDERLDLGNGPADFKCYRLNRSAWQAKRANTSN